MVVGGPQPDSQLGFGVKNEFVSPKRSVHVQLALERSANTLFLPCLAEIAAGDGDLSSVGGGEQRETGDPAVWV